MSILFTFCAVTEHFPVLSYLIDRLYAEIVADGHGKQDNIFNVNDMKYSYVEDTKNFEIEFFVLICITYMPTLKFNYITAVCKFNHSNNADLIWKTVFIRNILVTCNA